MPAVQPNRVLSCPKLENVENPKGIPPSMPTYQPCESDFTLSLTSAFAIENGRIAASIATNNLIRIVKYFFHIDSFNLIVKIRRFLKL